MFRERQPYTAVLAVDAGLANVADAAARERGLAVPGDLSIVSFQGLTGPKRFAGPRSDFFELGRQAVDLLRGRSEGSRVRHVRLPTVWEPGKTLAKPRTQARSDPK
jgi:DNA-binding LacI/PurR family transcriptional regulator